MKPTTCLCTVAALAALMIGSTPTAIAAASVDYVNTEKMTDVPRYPSDLESMKLTLLEHFNLLAAKLPAGQDLHVDIIDIDLAGDVFPRVAIQDVRVMKGRADWPRMHLRYRIEQNGAVLRSGDRELSDPNYMMGANRYSNELYGHEKQMLDDWFRKDVQGGAKPKS